MSASSDECEALLDELLAVREDAVPSLLTKHMDTVLSLRFLNALQSRVSASEVYGSDGARLGADASPEHKQQLQWLFKTVLDFSDGVASGLEKVIPEVKAKERELAAATMAAEEAAAAKATSPPRDARARPQRRSAASESLAQSKYAPMLEVIGCTAEDAERIERARSRFNLEKLLNAAATSMEALEDALSDLSSELDASFFKHMQWEVEQQIAKKNSQLLEILELVIRRACMQVEAGEPAVQLLSLLLQIKDVTVRMEQYAKVLAPSPPQVKAKFEMAVRDTQLQLEKALLRGEPIDRELLRQLRLIAIEMEPYIAGGDDDALGI